MFDLSILNQAPPTYTGPDKPDINILRLKVTDGEISEWMLQHSGWVEHRGLMYMGTRYSMPWQSCIQTQHALTNPGCNDEARQAIAQDRHNKILTDYNTQHTRFEGELLQYYIRTSEALKEFIKEIETERDDAIKKSREEIVNKNCENMQLKEKDDKIISEHDDTIKQLGDEIAKKNEEIKRLSIEVAYYKLDLKKPEEQKQVEAQLNPNVNDLLLKAAETNDYDAAKYALDHGADNDTCAKAFPLTKEPRIKIMLFAISERKQDSDNVPQITIVQPDKTFEPENDKHLLSHWPLEANEIDIKHLNTAKLYGADVVPDRFNNAESACHFNGDAFMKGDANRFPKGNRAISLWFKADKNTDGNIEGGTLFSYSGEDDSNNLAIVLNHDLNHTAEKSENICAYSLGKPGKSIKYNASSEDHFDEWNHLVISSDNGEGTNIYLNGECVAKSDICFNSENLKKSIQTFGIGAFVYEGRPVVNSIDPMFKGAITDVMLYSRGLSNEEVSALYQVQLKKLDTDANLKQWMQENAPDTYKQYQLSFFQAKTTQNDSKALAKNAQNDSKASESTTAEKEPKPDMQHFA